jgi:hypothetical protein
MRLGPTANSRAERATLARLRSVIVHRLPAAPYSAMLNAQWSSGSGAPRRIAQP